MGIKFKDKSSLGVPQPGDIAERELHFSMKDNSAYSSTNGTDIVKISGENTLGNPGVDGSTLVSTIAGVRSWIAPTAASNMKNAAAIFSNTVSITATAVESLLAMGDNAVVNTDFSLAGGGITINKDMLLDIKTNSNFNEGSNRAEVVTYVKHNGVVIPTSYARAYIRGNGEVDNANCYGHALIQVVAGDTIELFTQSLTTDSTTLVGECSILVSNAEGISGIDGLQGLQGAIGPVGGTIALGGTTGQHLAKASAVDNHTEWVTPPTPVILATQAEVDIGIDALKYVTPETLANAAKWDEKIDSDTAAALTGIKVENLVVCTQPQYDSITPDPTTVYMIRD